MTLADAVVICAKVLKMPTEAIAMAYAIPVAEIERIVAASTKRRTGARAVARNVNVVVKGASSS